MKTNIGFNNRVFLTKSEWQTFIKRMPVRYIKKKKKQICEVCFQPPTKDNPLESSHIIGFKIGIVNFALTPDFLDKDQNIYSAHKRKCNKKVELDLVGTCLRLKELGIKFLPNFLPKDTIETWNKIYSNKVSI